MIKISTEIARCAELVFGVGAWHELLGPIVVTADPARIFPFYGIAKLPMKMEHCKVEKQ